ncbi:mucin-17-like isoform X5 [Epinephelus moara]|uniref:mucin-17-like isoform X5 n=1 Tax=Epinephelus moara TaxID=300413 RepID=UPI00214EA9C2|nr:mucin-17-like isoform X5 [Epinephelus moara]
MAIYKNGLTICALLVTLTILETGNFNDSSSQVLPVHNEEEPFLPHTREKRNVPTGQWNYIIDVVVNASNVETFEQIRSSLNATSLPNQLDNNTKVSDISITTVCSSTGTGSLCRCEEHFAWPYSSCVTYGACDHLSSGICKCINVIPADGQFCQPISALLAQVEYAVDVELNVADFETVDYLRSFLDNSNVPLTLAPTVNVTQVDITTVCYLNGTNSQCRCEEQYVWSHGDCNTYGACDEVIDETCGCINNIPTNGRFCKPKTVPPVISEYQIFIEVNTTDADQLRNTLKTIPFPVQISNQINISDAGITTVCSPYDTGFQCRCEDDYLWPCDKCAIYGKCDGDTNSTCGCIKTIPVDRQYCQSIHHQNFTVCSLTTTSPSTAPPVVYEYILSVELNISDVTLINQLRIILKNINYPININNQIQINNVNISTVCSLSSGGYQCRCEDQYLWSCDQCFTYGSCNNITDDTCGCISAIPPDGIYCQPADWNNFTACPLTTVSPSPTPTTPPVVYEYIFSIELNISDITVVNQLRNILRNINYPISITNRIQINDVSISTVCSLGSGGYQCRCEDQYRWSCDQCFLYRSCDNITDDTCACISVIPPDGQYCKPADQHRFTSCPITTPSPSPTPQVVYEYLISIELNTTDVTVIDRLRTFSYPISINDDVQVSDINITTFCSLSSGGYQCSCEDQYRWSCDQCFLYGSCDNITDDTCGCISAIPPDGQYCQPANQHNFTACPLTTTPSPTASAAPPVIYEYIISVELNISDVTLINQLRTILRNISYPVSINNQIQIHDVNITTVCYPNGKTFQCKCEEQYRWPCQMCSTFGNCDDIIDNTCECINAIPPYGLYCQTVSDLFICPSPNPPNGTTTVAPTQNPTILTPTPTVITDSTSVVTTDMNTATANTPTASLTSSTTVSTTAVNTTAVTTTTTKTTTTAVTSPTTVATTAVNTTAVTTPTITTNSSTAGATTVNTTAITTTPTIITNSTAVATTVVNTTTVTMTPTIITNSTTVATTAVNTTAVTTTPTTVTNSTTADATTVNTTAITTTPTIITNSTAVATTVVNTTVTTTPTTITNSTTVATTAVNTTAITTTPTIITNSTAVATTVVNTTTVTTTPTIITNSITIATTVATTPMTTSTTAATPVTNATSTPAPTTALTTARSTKATTTTVMASTKATIRVTTTISPTTTPTTATGSSAPSTTRASTSTPAITTMPPTTAVTGFDVEMSIELDKEYTAELNDATSATYKDLERRINAVLEKQYEGLTGFIDVSVSRFREGSIITDFVVETTEVIADEVAEANGKLREAMQPIATVIGPVTASYNSTTTISFPSLTYTGNTMLLTCGPPENVNVGQISGSVWKFQGREIKERGRLEVTTSRMESVLTVKNVILADIGHYECTLTGGVINFHQNGDITRNEIRPAPIVRLQSRVNVKCDGTEGQKPLQCCVQYPYKVRWFLGSNDSPLDVTVTTNNGETYCITHDYQLQSCSESQSIQFTCKVDDPEGYEKTTNMIIFREEFTCKDPPYGTGRVDDKSIIGCDNGQEGSRTAVCQETGEWNILEDTCIITQIKELLIDSEDLVVEEVPVFVVNLSATVREEKTEVANSSATISAIVDIIQNIATVSTEEVTRPVIENILETVDVIIGDDSRESWAVLNANQTRNASSELLASLESLSNGLVGEFDFATERILLNRTMFNNSFRADLNNSILIDIPDTNLFNVSITTITFSTLYNVMPPRNSSFEVSLFNTTSNDTVTANAINAAVVLVQINETIRNVTLSYDKLNSSLSLYPQCVFWNFTLFDKLGAWDDKGCTFVSDINNTVTCSCNHLTSFSILMATDIPQDLILALDIITYVGVGISLASLVVCLIIEGYVWKAITRNSTAFMRHVSIINTALSLLIADICFIIAASIAKNPLENPREDYTVSVGPCSTATFFMHFFFLALFFWMFVSGLLLFYRTVMVFSHMSKSTMLAIGFTLGYGCPLMIAVITVAVTAPNDEYIRRDQACWLNWFESMALLAMVIPALTIVFINILIVIVVLFKMLRRGVGDAAQTDEKHTMVVIIRCVVILTPLFGLTWSLGVGTMISPTDRGIHIAFAFFNSLQGFFILVFGTLFDSKIRSILSRKLPTSSTGSGSNPTRSTNTGISSVSGLSWISRLRGRRYIYRVSEAANSSSTGASESFINI